MENQTKYLFYSLSRNSNNPLDSRLKINSLNNIDEELPVYYRYSGLIFFVIDINKHYLFLNDILTPIALQTLINSGQVNAVISNNYSNLITELNNTTSTIGSLITVYPLNVTFIFDGINWNYFTGIYNFTTNIQFETLPLQLRSINKNILIGTVNKIKYIYLSTLDKSTEIINFSVIPSILEDNRYYEKNGILYYSINNILYKLSEKFYFIDNYLLNNGINQINHNLNSTYISGLIWINNINTNTNKLIQLSIDIIDLNNIYFESQFNLTNTKLLLTAKF